MGNALGNQSRKIHLGSYHNSINPDEIKLMWNSRHGVDQGSVQVMDGENYRPRGSAEERKRRITADSNLTHRSIDPPLPSFFLISPTPMLFR